MTKPNTLAAVLSAGAAAISVSPAIAADLGTYEPPPPQYAKPVYDALPPVWRGAYFGVNAGYGWGDADGNLSGPAFATAYSADPEGWFGGVQAGYNFQRNSFVWGLEGDVQLADIADSTSSAAFPSRFSTDLDWYSTLRGRAGIAFDRTLLYVTGGFAFGEVENAFAATNGATAVSGAASDIETGYVVGGGLEYMIAPNLTTKAEYQYVDFGDRTVSGIGTDGNAYTSRVDADFHTFRLGLNYKF